MFDRLEQLKGLRSGYEQNGWTVALQMFPREVIDAVLYRFRSDLGGEPGAYKGIWGKGPFTDEHCFEAYVYDYPPQAMFLWALTPWMQALTGKRLAPTGSYFRVYRKGDICKLHADRFAAEHAITLTLGYSDGIKWPLWISEEQMEARLDGRSAAEFVPEGKKMSFFKAPMEPGDAVIYQGMKHIHGRMDPNPNAWSAHVFLNWVDADGPFAKEAFDGRRDEVVRPSEFRFPDPQGA